MYLLGDWRIPLFCLHTHLHLFFPFCSYSKSLPDETMLENEYSFFSAEENEGPELKEEWDSLIV